MTKESCIYYADFIKDKHSINPKIILDPLGVVGKKNTFIYLKNSLEVNGFIDYIYYPQKIIEDFSRKPNLIKPFYVQKEVSKLFQTVWITDNDNPTLVIKGIENFFAQAKKLNGYTVVLYTNISPSKLVEHNPILKVEKIEVKNISEINTEYTQLLDLIVSPRNHIKVADNIKNNPYFGILIDIAKYLVAESTGGIITDLNFHFDPNFEQSVLEKHAFIGILDNVFRLENGFFASANPHHIIFKELLKIIDQMFNNDCVLATLKGSLGIDSTTELFSMLPLSLAYMKYNNIENNNDALLYVNCKNYNNNNHDYSPNFLDMIDNHQKISNTIDIYDSEKISNFIKSYSNIINQSYEYFGFSCLENSMVGEDNNMEMSWR